MVYTVGRIIGALEVLPSYPLHLCQSLNGLNSGPDCSYLFRSKSFEGHCSLEFKLVVTCADDTQLFLGCVIMQILQFALNLLKFKNNVTNYSSENFLEIGDTFLRLSRQNISKNLLKVINSFLMNLFQLKDIKISLKH